MALGPDEIRSYDEVKKVPPYHETEAFRNPEGHPIGGYHEHQGFNAFASNDPIHHHNVSGIENKGLITPQEQERREREKGKKLTINNCFMDAASGITPLTAFQNNVLSAVMGDLQTAAANSIDPERAAEVIQETQELIEQSPEMAEAVQQGHIVAARDSNGNVQVTKADWAARNEELQMTQVAASIEETNEHIKNDNMQFVNDRAHLAPQKTMNEILNPEATNAQMSPVEPKPSFFDQF